MCRMSTLSAPHGESVILAAGGILLRKSASGDEKVCIVVRKQYGDWPLPKGKLETGESFQSAAHREVREETGWDNEISTYVGAMGYEVQGIPKVVLFWRMVAIVEVGVSNPQEIIKSEW